MSRPEIVGPMIRAIWKPVADQAMAFARSSLGTRLGTIAIWAGAWNARATPNSTSTARIAPKSMLPVHVPQRSTAAQTVWSATQPRMIRMRGNRSAATPETRKSSAKGANWAKPMRPRLSSLDVSR